MFGGILREFWEILGKYRMLDLESVGSKGIMELFPHCGEVTLNPTTIQDRFSLCCDTPENMFSLPLTDQDDGATNESISNQ